MTINAFSFLYSSQGFLLETGRSFSFVARQFYLEALDQNVKLAHENPSIGILLCREKDNEVVKLALNRSLSPTVIADYETKLIPKELLRQKLNELYSLLEGNDL